MPKRSSWVAVRMPKTMATTEVNATVTPTQRASSRGSSSEMSGFGLWSVGTEPSTVTTVIASAAAINQPVIRTVRMRISSARTRSRTSLASGQAEEGLLERADGEQPVQHDAVLGCESADRGWLGVDPETITGAAGDQARVAED